MSCSPQCLDLQLEPRLWNTEALITGKQTNLEQKAHALVSGGGRDSNFLYNKCSSLGCFAFALYPLQQFSLQASEHKNTVKPRYFAQINDNFPSLSLKPLLLFFLHQQNSVVLAALLHSRHSNRDFKRNLCTTSSSTRR